MNKFTLTKREEDYIQAFLTNVHSATYYGKGKFADYSCRAMRELSFLFGGILSISRMHKRTDEDANMNDVLRMRLKGIDSLDTLVRDLIPQRVWRCIEKAWDSVYGEDEEDDYD